MRGEPRFILKAVRRAGPSPGSLCSPPSPQRGEGKNARAQGTRSLGSLAFKFSRGPTAGGAYGFGAGADEGGGVIVGGVMLGPGPGCNTGVVPGGGGMVTPPGNVAGTEVSGSCG